MTTRKLHRAFAATMLALAAASAAAGSASAGLIDGRYEYFMAMSDFRVDYPTSR